ncbi:hypothetical protein [Halomonas aquatica]|uniref:Uncharacterized protein n=1 Tax=Halomonas aquatica TaxID=3151123 RepID=A0ABV1NBY5_9GAMM
MQGIVIFILGAMLPVIIKMAPNWRLNHALNKKLMTPDIISKAESLSKTEAEIEKNFSKLATKKQDENGVYRFLIGEIEVAEAEWNAYTNGLIQHLNKEAELIKEIYPKEERIDSIMRTWGININNPLKERRRRSYEKYIKRTGGLRIHYPAEKVATIQQDNRDP